MVMNPCCIGLARRSLTPHFDVTCSHFVSGISDNFFCLDVSAGIRGTLFGDRAAMCPGAEWRLDVGGR